MNTRPVGATPPGSPVVGLEATRCLLLVLDGHSYRQAAEALELPPAEVARHLRDALRCFGAGLSDIR